MVYFAGCRGPTCLWQLTLNFLPKARTKLIITRDHLVLKKGPYPRTRSSDSECNQFQIWLHFPTAQQMCKLCWRLHSSSRIPSRAEWSHASKGTATFIAGKKSDVKASCGIFYTNISSGHTDTLFSIYTSDYHS